MATLVESTVDNWGGGNSQIPYVLRRTTNGVLWAIWNESFSDGTGQIFAKYSLDDGATWSAVATLEAKSEYGTTAGSYQTEFAADIDEDDNLHLFYKAENGNIRYRRCTPNAERTSWGVGGYTDLETGSAAQGIRYPQMVSFRDPAGGWQVVVTAAYDNTANGWGRAACYWRIPIDVNGNNDFPEADGLPIVGGLTFAGELSTTQPGNWCFPHVTFHHGGDGKIVKNGTPHLYFAWTGQANSVGQGILFRTAQYAGGAWTFADVLELDSTRRGTGSAQPWISFDGSRAVIAGMFHNGTDWDLMVYERTADNMVGQVRVLMASVSALSDYLFSGFSMTDFDGDVHFVGRDASGSSGTRKLNLRTWIRSSGTLGPIVTLESNAINNILASPKPHTQNMLLEFLYDNSTTSGSLDLYHRSHQLNRTPGTPQIVSPNGAEVVNDLYEVSASGSDPDGDTLLFDYDLTTDNGASWYRIITDGSASQTYDFTNEPATTAARVRVRTRDSLGKTSEWDESDANFTIQHNRPPYAPELVSPVGNSVIDLTSANRLEFNPLDPDTGDTKSKHDIEWRVANSGDVPTMLTAGNTLHYHETPAGYFSEGPKEWRARTYDSQGEVGPWSGWEYFTAATPPAGPTITSHANNETIATSTDTLEWSTPAQEGFRVRKVGDDGAGNPDPTNVLFDTGERTTASDASVRSQALEFPENGRVEHLQVMVWVDGLWSTWTSVRTPVDYAAPSTAPVSLVPRRDLAAIRIMVNNPEPVAPEPQVSENWLYRREAGSVAWNRIAIIPPNTLYEDRTVASGVPYEYWVSARGENETSTASEVYVATVHFTGIWLLDPRDPGGTAHQFKWDGMGRRSEWQPETFKQDFVGRTFPVVEWGEHESHTIQASLALDTEQGDLAALRNLSRARTILLYRDGRGRKAYVHVPRYPIEDRVYGGMLSFSAYEVDYTEGV